MAENYSGNPASTPKDAVRFLTNDVGPTFEFSDEEILFALSTEGNIWLASALLCERVAAGQTGGGGLLTSKSIGGLSESYSSSATATAWYTNAAKYYRSRGGGASGSKAVPTFNSSMPQYFSMKQFDFPGSRSPRVKDDTHDVILPWDSEEP